MRIIKTASLIILISASNVNGQINDTDSLEVTKIVTNFYNWYILSTKHNDFMDTGPIFLTDTNGVVRLDYSKYIAKLKKYNFADTLIYKEILTYKNCEDNLKNISKSDFLKFEDLDDYENIDCAFSNSYRWIGGQEMCDGVRVNSVDFLDMKNCYLTIEFYNISNENRYYWGNNIKVSLLRIYNKWEICDIEI